MSGKGWTNARLKAARDLAKAKGLCGTCRIRRPRPGYRTCDTCLDVVSRPSAIAVAFLVCCQSACGHRHGCVEDLPVDIT